MTSQPPRWRRASGLIGALLLAGAGAAASAAPYRPSDDAQVLERLPERSADPRMRELRRLRQQLSATPTNLALALQVARLYYAAVAAEGDPRYIGYAQAALAPWLALAEPPAEVRVLRAVLNQFNHGFDAAVADLQAVVQREPDQGEAWSWLAAIAMVQARYADARSACAQVARLASPLIATACSAAVDASTGRAGAAVAALREALRQPAAQQPAERLWALTRLAEAQLRLADAAGAEASFREALALGISDGYLLAAYSDFLLAAGRPAEVLQLLKGMQRSDLLLLRLALAGQKTNAPEQAAWVADLDARFQAARLRGDKVHEKEEARFALQLRADPARALVLAANNFAVQREPADARMLLQAAVAAGQRGPAEPALRWLADARIEDPELQALAARLPPAAKGKP